MKKILLFALILFAFCVTAHAEQLTLSTFYPAPLGNYDRMRLVPRALPTCDANSEGLMVYNDTANAALNLAEGLYVCGGGNTWEEFGSGIWDTNRATGDIFVHNSITNPQIGIGTTTPAVELDVVGDSNISGDVGIGGALTVTGDTTLNGTTTTNGLLVANNLSTFNNDVHILNGGSLGIGNNSPSEALDVTGNGVISGNFTVNGTTNVGGDTNVIGDINITGDILGTDHGEFNTLHVLQTSQLDGHVGVGVTPNGTWGLDVADGLRVGTSGTWPDGYFAMNSSGFVMRATTTTRALDVSRTNGVYVGGRLGVGVANAFQQEKVHIAGDGGNLYLEGGQIYFNNGSGKGPMPVSYVSGSYYAVYAPGP